MPVMVAENANPFTAIRHSLALLRQSWGAQFVGNTGIGFVFFLLAIPGVLPLALGFSSGRIVLLIPGVMIVAIYWSVLAIVSTA